MEFFITCQPGLSQLLAAELQATGLQATPDGGAAVRLEGDTGAALRVCMYSRIAERVLAPLDEVDGEPVEAARILARRLDWQAHCALAARVHLRVEHGSGVSGDSRRTAEAFVDQAPPGVPEITGEPDQALCLHLRVFRGGARLHVDLAGLSLQRRGYRLQGGEAPLRETLAAAMLQAAGWPDRYAPPVLMDPFCGSGTLVLEAAAMACRRAPGPGREDYGFRHWSGCRRGVWERLCEQAREEEIRPEGLSLKGFDADPRALRQATANAERAGLAGVVHFERRELGALRRRDFAAPRGLVATNPPWGERLETGFRAGWLHAALGRVLGEHARQWQLMLLGSEAGVMERTGMPLVEQWVVRNGPHQVRMRLLEPRAPAPEAPLRVAGEPAFEVPEEAVPLLNRLRKNGRHLRRWLDREDIEVWRLYDRELPQFNLAVDVYGRNVLVHEFAAPASVPEREAEHRRGLALTAVRAALGVHREHVFLRTRQRQRPGRQYRRRQDSGEYHVVREGRARLLVNLRDYLDAGLFPDHRPVRLAMGEQARGKRFLNLFGYTGAATAHAALGGASSSVTVDASARYLEWAAGNLALNGFSTVHHRLERGDAMQWLEQAREQFDLVFCDPPTFSNSKDRPDFAVQRDHARLIDLIMKRVEPGGVLYFSCNFRRFQLDEKVHRDFHVEDITRWSIPADFRRNPHVHYCFRIRHAD